MTRLKSDLPLKLHPAGDAALTSIDLAFLSDGGDMGARIRAFDWTGTPLGPPAHWPQALRTATRVMLTTGHPMMIMWGPELIGLYNDAFSRSLGPEKHPAILGAPGRRSWAEVWPVVGAQIEQVLRGGKAIWRENELVPIIRRGRLEEVYWTYSYNPIDEPSSANGVGGVLVVCSETTERVQLEKRLLAERERFVQLFDQAPTFLALLSGPDHVIELANPGYLKLVGYRPVVGRTVAEALPETVAQGYVELLDEVYRTGKPFSADGAKYTGAVSAESPTGERYVDFVFQPIVDRDGAVTGILVQGVDVTAHAMTQRALELNRARLDYAIRLSGVGFWYCDLPFDELVWDERVKEHFFFAPTDRITIDDFYARIHPEDREPTRRAIDASIADRAPYDVVYRTVHPLTRAVKWIRALGGTDYDAEGKPTHFDGVTVDFTAQRAAQQRVADLNQRLQEQDRRKDEFLAMLAHELRNPLAPIRNAVEICARAVPADSRAQPAIAILQRQVTHLTRLVDDLLDVARISQGRFELKMEVLEVNPLVDMAVETVAPLMADKRHDLSILRTAQPAFVRGDARRLVQILSNILVNAAKYTAAGGRIELRAEASEKTVSVSVSDNGVGIPAELLPRIFDLFIQGEQTRDRAQGGLGIGLSVVRQLVETQGGRCAARSAGPGQGSTFEITLPRVEPAR